MLRVVSDKLRFLEEKGTALHDDDRVRELAEYPDVPDGLFGAPSYFLQVLRRRGELKKEAAQAEVVANEAKAALERAIAGAATGEQASGVTEEARQRQAELRSLEGEEGHVKEEIANLEAAKGRVQAKLRRAEIEVRNLSLLVAKKN